MTQFVKSTDIETKIYPREPSRTAGSNPNDDIIFYLVIMQKYIYIFLLLYFNRRYKFSFIYRHHIIKINHIVEVGIINSFVIVWKWLNGVEELV